MTSEVTRKATLIGEPPSLRVRVSLAHRVGGLRGSEPARFADGRQAKRENGRSERIRTSGPCVPNTVLYQAELHSGAGSAAEAAV